MACAPRIEPFSPLVQRLACYQYLAPVLVGKRVLEVGCGCGRGLLRLLHLGAARVDGLEREPERVATLAAALRDRAHVHAFSAALADRAFLDARYDWVIVSDAALLLEARERGAQLFAQLDPAGYGAVFAASADHSRAAAGVHYEALLELVEPYFSLVRVLGVSPLYACGIVELREEEDAAETEIALDGGLLGGGAEEVVSYLVLGTRQRAAEALDHGIVQVPAGGLPELDRALGFEAEPLLQGTGAFPPASSPEPGLPAGATGTRRFGAELLARWRWPTFSREP